MSKPIHFGALETSNYATSTLSVRALDFVRSNSTIILLGLGGAIAYLLMTEKKKKKA